MKLVTLTILAWLFHLTGNHQLDDYIIRKMLGHVLLMEESENDTSMESIPSLLHHFFVNRHVFRKAKTDESRFIDLFIVSEQINTVLPIASLS